MPNLIVTSPYLRTKQTAQPTFERFPDVPVEIWPVQEFTYLEPSRWNGTLVRERRERVESYWRECDPEFCDGPGAESFVTLLRRNEDALRTLTTLPPGTEVFIFSHALFMQAIRVTVVDAYAPARQKMGNFVSACRMSPIQNEMAMALQLEEDGWQLVPVVY